jgi:hypothetical protein
VHQIQTLLERAGCWLLRSGIQDESGGVARYYRSDLGRNARISTEITGYAASCFAWLHERTGRAEYAEASLRAARFLTRAAWDRRLAIFPFEYAANGDAPPALAYFFDSGIIIRGLLSAWRMSGEAELLDAAVAAGHSMLENFQNGAAVHPILALPGKRPLPYEPRWSASPGCYQLKSALAWHDLAAETGEPRFLAAYEAVLEQSLASHGAFLDGDADREKIMDRLHAYAYFLEGLLPVLDRPRCAAVYRDGVERIANRLRAIEPLFVRSDVYGQLLRARLFGAALASAPLHATEAAREAAEAATFQIESADVRTQGGFGFGRKASGPLPFVNPVSTAFCLQALAFWHDHQAGAFEARRHALI